MSPALFAAIAAPGDDVFGVIKAVQEGADLNVDYEGRLPLEFAILKKKFERFKTLSAIEPTVGKGANLSATVLVGKKKTEMTYLHLAATLSLSQIVKYLLSKGVDKTLRDKHPRGLLPIHYAAHSGDCATLDVLNDNKQAILAVSGSGDFCLHLAAEHGKIAMAQHLLDLGADPNCRDHDGRIPLHRAAQRGQKKMVEFLLTQRTSRNYWDKQGRNSFLYAVESGNTELIPLLVLNDDKYTECDLQGIGAMHIAAEKNKAEMMRFLNGKQGLTYLVKDKKDRMPIHFAAEHNAMEVFDLLITDLRQELTSVLSKRCQPDQLEQTIAINLRKLLLSWQDQAGDTVIEYAVRGKAFAVINRLLELGVDLNRTNTLGSTPMHEAAKAGDVEVMTLLNRHGVSYTQRNRNGQRPVHIAAEHGQIAVLEAFQQIPTIDFKAKDNDDMLPIHWACCAGKREAVDWLLVNNGGRLNDVDKHGRDCLFHAVRGDQVELIDYLVKGKKMFPALCSKGLTIMHHAVFKCAEKSIDALLQLGISIDVPGKGGMLSLHLATRSGLTKMVDLLVAKGAKKNACNDLGRNAWFYAAGMQTTEMLECLAKHQVPLHGIQDQFGMTPVHTAALGGNLAALQFLQNKGLSCFAKDKSGNTPLATARKQREKSEKELAAGGDDEKRRIAESRIAGCKAVESYLLSLEQAEVDLYQPVMSDKKKTATTGKREPEDRAEPAVNSRIIKPRLYAPKKAEEADNDREDSNDHKFTH